jgi:serine O-acetyltransferase
MRINSKKDLEIFLESDRISLGVKRKKPPLISKSETELLWKYQVLLRKIEYRVNCKKGLANKIWLNVLKYKYFKKQVKYGVVVPPNVFGPGLSIAHIGPIIINATAKVGKNCRLHINTNIGMNGREKHAAVLGDDVYLSIGSKIIGNVTIPDRVVVGANAVVTKSINESDITVGGVPAKKISDNGTSFPIDRRGYDIATSGDV